jgi:hypothetical protein
MKVRVSHVEMDRAKEIILILKFEDGVKKVYLKKRG